MNFFSSIKVSDIFDIAIISAIVYYIILFIKETKTIQLLKGIFILFIVMLFAQILNLTTLNWLLEKIFALGILALVVIFQPELRNMLRKLGTEQILPFSSIHSKEMNELIEAVKYLSENKIGCLIAIEKKTPLTSYAETGSKIDAIIDRRLIMSIFYPDNPLHDGAVIIQNNRILAAGCILPVEPEKYGNYLGSRHLAALKLSEETDALVIVVSEETGEISLSEEGKLYQDISPEKLRRKIEESFGGVRK